MGRGLSELQKTILLRALSNRERECGEKVPVPVDVYSCEIAADYFGWPLPYRDFYGREPGEKGRVYRRLFHRCRRPPGMPKEQGNRVHASISRALGRLQERGLGLAHHGIIRWSGFKLNDHGIERARQLRLSVNLYSKCDLINR